MNDTFDQQKDRLLSIKHEISLLYQQVNYLLRNQKALELLDLDVLMNRTHTLYDLLCSINLGAEPAADDLELDPEAFAGLFGGMMQEKAEDELAPEPVETPEPEPIVMPEPEPAAVSEPEPEPMPEPEPEPQKEPEPVVEDEPENEATAPKDEPEAPNDEKPLGDEYGFFFRFEDIPEREETPAEEVPTMEKDGKVIHVMEEIPEEEIPERDRVHGEDLVQDNPFEMPKMEKEMTPDEVEEMGRANSEGVSGFFEQDDADFELSTGETLGETLMGEDHSLASKLQQNPIPDLKSAIGINDKFLFVNELFGGSMEKYNKSIENLNDLKTLNGALIYLNELKIELQWNSSNEAYQKLKDLVSRKFE